MNQSDIKLIIDRLHSVDMFIAAEDNLAVAEAINTLEQLGNKVAKQAAVIEKLRTALETVNVLALCGKKDESPGRLDKINKIAFNALAIPTDSKQILAEWLDSHLGLPTAWSYQNAYTDHVYLKWDKTEGGRRWVPLFRKPEIK